MNVAMNNGVGVEFMHLSPTTPPATNAKTRLIVMNSNWHNRDDLPIQFAHELGHIFNNDDSQSCLYFSPSRNGIEGRANKTGIALLMKPYLESKEKEEVSSADFITKFHLPLLFEDIVIDEMNKFYT